MRLVVLLLDEAHSVVVWSESFHLREVKLRKDVGRNSLREGRNEAERRKVKAQTGRTAIAAISCEADPEFSDQRGRENVRVSCEHRIATVEDRLNARRSLPWKSFVNENIRSLIFLIEAVANKKRVFVIEDMIDAREQASAISAFSSGLSEVVASGSGVTGTVR